MPNVPGVACKNKVAGTKEQRELFGNSKGVVIFRIYFKGIMAIGNILTWDLRERKNSKMTPLFFGLVNSQIRVTI